MNKEKLDMSASTSNLYFSSPEIDFSSFPSTVFLPTEMSDPKRRKQFEFDPSSGSEIQTSVPSISEFLTTLDFQVQPTQHTIPSEAKPEFVFGSGSGSEQEPESDRPRKKRCSPKSASQRRLWVKDRSREWWDRCNSPDFPEEEFRKAFRMGRATFDMICEELGSAIAKEDTTLRAAIPVRQRVAVCVWRLATGMPLRDVSKRFGLGISTCHKLVLEVCSAIRTVLMPKFLQWPDDARAEIIKAGFQATTGIPDVVGAMHTTHVPIIAPKENVAAYFNKRQTERNQRTSYSITVQGVVDASGVFTDVCIGWPGSMEDEAVLEKSALSQRAAAGKLNGQWVAGGKGHPLTDWMVVPYTQQNLTWAQHAFNEKVAEARGAAEGAFARLKGRWACLQRRTEVKLQDLPVVLGACCVLHNICEINGEAIEGEDWSYDPLYDDGPVPEVVVRSNYAKQRRDAIAHNLLHGGLVMNQSVAFF